MSLADKILEGDTRAAARLMRDIDDRQPGYKETLKALYPHTGGAHVIGVTGSPGAGKSTLVDQLLSIYRRRDRRVGVVAVDPTSPFSGGAILGDRIRMQRHATDPGVFIRSVATRGELGGLSRSASDIARVLDAMGMGVVIVETVGVGQDEVDVARMAHSVAVVTAPGLGDEVQAIKAGILEIADIFVVNKADRDGADAAVRDLEMMLHLGGDRAWTPPVLRTVATSGEGVGELVETLERHRAFLGQHPEGAARIERRQREEVERRVKDGIAEAGLARVAGAIGPMVERLVARQVDPYTAADDLVKLALLASSEGSATIVA